MPPVPRETLERLVTSAALAPSPHNTQPWFVAELDAGLELYADRTRGLPVNDPTDRELTISCGAALLNLRLAAASAGLRADVDVLPEPADEDLLARVRLARAPGRTGARERRLAAAIPQRHTWRRPFAPVPVDPVTLAAMVDAAEREGAWLHVTDDDQREAVAELVDLGDREQFHDPRWRREVAAWRHPRRQGDGLPVGTLTGPVTRFVVSTLDRGAQAGSHDAELVRAAPVVAVLGTPGDETADWLAAGQALERALLVAAQAGVLVGYANQPCQVGGTLRERLRDVLGRPGHPQVVVCAGHPTEPAEPAPRRPVEAILLERS